MIIPNAETIALALGGRRAGSHWLAPCPTHEDTDDPSSPKRPNRIDAYLEKKGYFDLSLEQAIFESGSEAAPGKSTPCSTPSPAPTPRKNRRGSGNRCGHDPKNPNFAPPPPDNYPKITQKAAEKVRAAYTDPRDPLGLNYHPWGFKVRSERREAIFRVLAAFVENMDLVTLRVGFRPKNRVLNNEFVNRPLAYLAKQTGMGLRRVARAIHDIKKMGFIRISQIRERLQNGSYRSFAAIKTVSPTLFDALGLRKWLEKERPKASVRLPRRFFPGSSPGVSF